jgi:hypothetical protein
MNLICKIGVTAAVLMSSIVTASAQNNIRSYDQRSAYSNAWDDGYGMVAPGTEAQRITGSNGG